MLVKVVVTQLNNLTYCKEKVIYFTDRIQIFIGVREKSRCQVAREDLIYDSIT